jgi:hypothetical protein
MEGKKSIEYTFWGCSSVVEFFLSMRMALGSVLCPEQTGERGEEKREEKKRKRGERS